MPSIVPNDNDETVYLVADDIGRIGRAWREADYETTDLETVIQDLLTGQYSNPIRVVAFNTAERSGRKTFPKTSPANCAYAAIYTCANFPPRSLISSKGHEGPDRRQLSLWLA
jgi:hypothetical protein